MFFVWMAIICFLQMTVLSEVNLLIALAVFSGLRKGPFAGGLIGLSIGFLAGVLSGAPLGINLFLYGFIAFISGIFKSHIYYKEDILTEIAFSFCGVVLFYLLDFALTKSVHVSVFSTALFTALVSPLLFRIVEK